MQTQCIQEQIVFQQLGRREVIGRFDGGMISSDTGGLLLREVERGFGILRRFAACFRDYRDSQRTEHSLKSLIRQRVYGIALGYEDLNDHDSLRHDVVMGVLCEKSDPCGSERARKRDRGKAIAGKSTLNRLELTPEDANEKSRYKKIVANGDQIDDLMVDVYIQAQPTAPEEVVLDIDNTDDILYGKQEGRFFHGYYGDYCYLPLYIFCGEHLLCARLRVASEEKDVRTLYEDFYCARGDMENRIKEQQLGLFADRTSTAWMRSNQLRLYFSSFAYIMMQRLRQLGLQGTELAQAQCDTIRLKLFKIGAQIEVTVRKVWISFSESYPSLNLFQRVFTRLQQIPSGG